MKTRILLAGAIALAFAAGTVALPSLADAAQQMHGGGGHGGGGHGGGGHAGGYRMGGAYHGGAYHGGGVDRGADGGGYGGSVYTAAAADQCRWSSGFAAPMATEAGSLCARGAIWTRRVEGSALTTSA